MLEFTSEYGISKDLHPELPGPEERIVDFPQDIDLFNLISAPNPTKVKTGTRPRAAHEVPLLAVTAICVIEMEDPVAATESSGTPSTIGKSPLDFDNENPAQQITEGAAPEVGLEEEVAAMRPLLSKKRRKRVNDRADANAPRKVPRKDHAFVHPEQSTRGGKSLLTMGLTADSTFVTPTDTKGVSDPDSLSFEIPTENVATMEVQDTHSAKSARSGKLTSSPSVVGSPEVIYQPGWDMTNSCHLDTTNACQYVVDHIVPLGIQVREEEIKRLDQEIQSLGLVELEVHGLKSQEKNLNTRLEAEVDINKAAEVKNAELSKELESLRARVEKRCAEMDARLDALSIEFGEELYPHMLTAIAGRRWVIGHDLRLAVIKCAESIELRQVFANVVSMGIAKGMSEGIEYGVKQGEAKLDLAAIEEYDLEADDKYIIALHALKDLKYPLVDQLGDAAKDAIAANVSRAEKKKKCRVVCRTHGVGSAYHARYDGILVSAPTVAPQDLAILLADAATQTETSKDDASPRMLISKSLPPMYNLD
nr:hypothetical protein [Tanacetum cinerariifolium]